MELSTWAEQECRIACKQKNPDFNFDSNDFDYTCSCIKSALKAYNSLCEDEHSGASFALTRNFLIRLMDNLPLTPITEEDFKDVIGFKLPNNAVAQQCPRMSSLFRITDAEGKVSFDDVERAYFIDIDNGSTFRTNTSFLDERYPITLPYYPSVNKFKIYVRTFLADKRNGDYDTRGILYMITPEGERVALNIFMTEKDKKMVSISREEYEKLYEKRIK